MDPALFGSRRYGAARRQASGSSPIRAEERTPSSGQPWLRLPKTSHMPPRRAQGALKQLEPNQLSIKQYAASKRIFTHLNLIGSLVQARLTADTSLSSCKILHC